MALLLACSAPGHLPDEVPDRFAQSPLTLSWPLVASPPGILRPYVERSFVVHRFSFRQSNHQAGFPADP